MNKELLIVVLLLVYLTAQSQTTRDKSTIWEKVYPPHNGVHMHDSIFMDESEIANIHWLEYLFYVKKDSSHEFYLSQLPDTSVWEFRLAPEDSTGHFADHYLRYPGFRYFPVVGVNYEQVVNYCRWRSAAVNLVIGKDERHKIRKKFDHYDVSVEYRLPTKEEWELAACGGLDREKFPYGVVRPVDNKRRSFKLRKNKDCMKCLDSLQITYTPNDVIHKVEFNVVDDYYLKLDKMISCTRFGNSGGDFWKEVDLMPCFIYRNPPNNGHLYNIIGNVSEFVAEKGIVKGGSYKDQLSDFDIGTDFTYEGPTKWIGFRCLAIVHLRKRSVRAFKHTRR